MVPRIGWMFAMSVTATLLAVGCQGNQDSSDTKPLSTEEAAKYRQVSINVTGMT